jgi:DNA-binding Lrp family transcriptional regulator
MVLIAIARDPGIRMRDIASQVGITERAAQRIVAELVDEDYVKRVRVGRRNQYEVDFDQPMRHPEARQADIGSVLRMLAMREKPGEAPDDGDEVAAEA